MKYRSMADRRTVSCKETIKEMKLGIGHGCRNRIIKGTHIICRRFSKAPLSYKHTSKVRLGFV